MQVADVDRILEAERESGKTFFPFQQNRLQPFFYKMQEVMASGVLGEIVHIRSSWSSFQRRWDWQTRQDLWGGSLLNTGEFADLPAPGFSSARFVTRDIRFLSVYAVDAVALIVDALAGPHAVDQALCLFGWDRTPEIFCRMDSRMHGFEGDAENHCTVCMCVSNCASLSVITICPDLFAALVRPCT